MGFFGFIHVNGIHCFHLHKEKISKKQLTVVSVLKNSLCVMTYAVCDNVIAMSCHRIFMLIRFFGIKVLEP